MNGFNSVGAISMAIAKGRFDPNIRLTNMAMSYFQSEENRPAKSLFPILPVQLSTASYYIWSKEDLLRDNVQRKPQFGKVNPAQMAFDTEIYRCDVDQIILGMDNIQQLDYQRTNAPSFMLAQNAKTRTISQQMLIHQDIIFANSFFKTGVWNEEWTGVASTPSGKQFIKFSDANSTPIQFLRDRISAMKKNGRKTNKLGLGENPFNALINHPDILSRIEGMGSADNPAIANETVLAKLFGLDKVVVFDAIVNKAKTGLESDMDFICDPDGALLVYATDTPSLEEPSAGYIFTWDMLGDGNYMPILQWDGEDGTHASFIEGLIAQDMKITANDLGCYFSDCV